MGFFSGRSDEERHADEEREVRRANKEAKARQLEWAEREAEKDPDSKLAREILRVNRNNL